VYKEEGNHNTRIIQITKANEKHIQEDIGLLVINEQLADLYTKLETELEIAERTKNELNKIQKPYLIFEGKTDNILFSLAYQTIEGSEFEDDYFLNKHEESNEGGSVGSGASFIGDFLRNHINKMPTENLLIGVFDFDNEGFNQLKNLKSQYGKVDINGFSDCIVYKTQSSS
jgi:hypothetical protein